MNLLKMQIPTDAAIIRYSSCFSVGLATIGVCVFCAVASVAALFIFIIEGEKTMALISCPKCNQNISDQAVKCIHCGEIILEKTCKECGNKFPADLSECPNCGLPVSTIQEKESIINKARKYKNPIIIGSILLTVVVLLSIMIGAIGSALTPDEQFAYDIVVSLQESMSDRDAFTLYDNIYIFKHYNENGENDYTYTIFDYGAATGYGGIVSETAIFKDFEYDLDYSDMERICNSNPNYSNPISNLAALQQKQAYLLIKFRIDACLEGKGETLGFKTIVVDAKKIQKILDKNN